MVRKKPSHWLLRCHVCGRTVPGNFEEIAGLAGNWPSCCHQVMSVYFKAEVPGRADRPDAPPDEPPS